MKKVRKVPTPDPQPSIPLADMLGTFRPIQQAKDQVLKGTTQPANLDLAAPAYGRSSAQAVAMATTAAEDNMIPSRFEAFRVKFSDELQAIMCVPEAKYLVVEKDLYKVSWSKDGTEFKVDLAYALVPLGWGTPEGMIRRAPLTLHRSLPGIGSALLIDLRAGHLRRSKKRKLKAGDATQATAKPKAAEPAPTDQAESAD